MSQQYNAFNGIGNSNGLSDIPRQDLPLKKKNKYWLKATVDFLYNDAIKQKSQNLVFSKIKRMTEGDFIYESVDIERTLHGDEAQQLKKLTNDVSLGTHLKNFDFLGVMANAIQSVFAEMDDKYRVVSTDEYSTNEYIRARTENLHKYGQAVLQAEVEKYLLQNGINPNKTDFSSEEEKQAYVQNLEAQVEKYSPKEFEKELSRNFKVIATDWANNVLSRDKETFHLDTEDRDRLMDYILTGRWFRHYRLGYDNYYIEDWRVEEVFFSRDVDTKFPQKQDHIGRLTEMSISKALSTYGHLMTTKQQENIGGFFNKEENYKDGVYPFASGSEKGLPFATNYILPFENYFDHQVNLQMEDYLGVPLGQTMNKDGTISTEWMPRQGNLQQGLGKGFSQNYRNDIQITDSKIQVMEVYWTSQQWMGILVYRNELGVLDVKQVSEDLIREFIDEHNIKVKKNVTLDEMQKAMRQERLEDYENTISWHLLPQSWYAVVLKSNNSLIMEEDMILWGKPTEFQITGNSDYYEILHPVGGIITKSQIIKALPYQQLHNVCLNQISELMADEPGTFYTFDVNAIPADMRDETTEETLFNMMDSIKLTKLMALDMSRQNLQGNTAYPNIFQKNEVVFASQVQYRREMAEYFKWQGMAQLGVTPQLLGTVINHETAEGVKQQATATYALINNIIDDFSSSKSRSNELHISIAQIAEVNGKSNSRLMHNSDGGNMFIDILAEDGEYFSLRKISVMPASNSKDRPNVKFLQQMLISDNTIMKDFGDLVDITTNPNVLKLRQIAREMRDRTDAKTNEDRQFQDSQLQKQLQASAQNQEKQQVNTLAQINLKGEWQYKEAYITSLGRDSASTKDDNFADIAREYELRLKETGIEQDMNIRMQDVQRKMDMDENTKKLEAEKLKIKKQELELKNKQISSQEYIATINKN